MSAKFIPITDHATIKIGENREIHVRTIEVVEPGKDPKIRFDIRVYMQTTRYTGYLSGGLSFGDAESAAEFCRVLGQLDPATLVAKPAPKAAKKKKK